MHRLMQGHFKGILDLYTIGMYMLIILQYFCNYSAKDMQLYDFNH